jgi:hypothetical protein
MFTWLATDSAKANTVGTSTRRSRKEFGFARLAAEAEAPMLVLDKPELSPTICAAVHKLVHKALRQCRGDFTHRWSAPLRLSTFVFIRRLVAPGQKFVRSLRLELWAIAAGHNAASAIDKRLWGCQTLYVQLTRARNGARSIWPAEVSCGDDRFTGRACESLCPPFGTCYSEPNICLSEPWWPLSLSGAQR